MTTKSGDYQRQLLLALRLRNVPGPRIAEALAEVDSHVAETGEDATEAFGEPKAYAGEIADALGVHEPLSARTIARSFTWSDAVTFGAFLIGPGLTFLGLAYFGAGKHGWLAPAAAAAGLLILIGAFSWQVSTQREADQVRDPRTGRDMTRPPAGRRSFVRRYHLLLACFIVAMLLLAYYSGVLSTQGH